MIRLYVFTHTRLWPLTPPSCSTHDPRDWFPSMNPVPYRRYLSCRRSLTLFFQRLFSISYFTGLVVGLSWFFSTAYVFYSHCPNSYYGLGFPKKFDISINRNVCSCDLFHKICFSTRPKHDDFSNNKWFTNFRGEYGINSWILVARVTLTSQTDHQIQYFKLSLHSFSVVKYYGTSECSRPCKS